MPINLRGRPIEGIISDNAGNVIRNAAITIKEDAPNGAFVIDSCKSDGDGYFISNPIKNGVYDVYESGVRVMRIYHSAQPQQLQAFSPNTPNVPSALPTFASYLVDPSTPVDINDFKMYLQMEPESIDVVRYGNMFPLWNADPVSGLSGHPFELMKNVHTGLSAASALTHTRFDIEYFNPIVRGNTSHRRIRWAGIPGIRFSNSSKIVLGLDYYGIIPKSKYSSLTIGESVAVAATKNISAINTVRLNLTTSYAETLAYYDGVAKGDIVKVVLANGKVFWGVFFFDSTPPADHKYMELKMWLSSNNTHNDQAVTDVDSLGLLSTTVVKLETYQGMFQGIETLNQSVSERFFVVENVSAQDLRDAISLADTELFNYGRA